MNRSHQIRLSAIIYMAEQKRLGQHVTEAQAIAIIRERLRSPDVRSMTQEDYSTALRKFCAERPDAHQEPESISDLGCNGSEP
jgi:hypothetical protein